MFGSSSHIHDHSAACHSFRDDDHYIPAETLGKELPWNDLPLMPLLRTRRLWCKRPTNHRDNPAGTCTRFRTCDRTEWNPVSEHWLKLSFLWSLVHLRREDSEIERINQIEQIEQIERIEQIEQVEHIERVNESKLNCFLPKAEFFFWN